MLRSALAPLRGVLPKGLLHELRRFHYYDQIRRHRFLSPEPEIGYLSAFVGPSEWVLDVGANVGHYTLALSDIVGPAGRVIAIEPVPSTFSLLAANVLRLANANVTLLNAAASDVAGVVGISIPGSNDSENFYQAHVAERGNTGLDVLSIRIDDLRVPHRVSLVKIDAEGHEGSVLLGMQALLRRDRPRLIIEAGARQADELLVELGYLPRRLPDSPNVILEVAD